MDMLYDTRTIHPLDRYDYYRAGAGIELAPVAVHGRAPGRFHAAMSVAQIGDFAIEVLIWSADSEVVTRRTERLIRASDPECYRMLLSISGEIRVEQEDNQADVRARDIVLYDVSRPCQATHSTGPGLMRVVMLTFPRALVPIPSARVRPLIGTLIPRSMPGRSLIAQFLIGLTGTAELRGDPDLAHVLYECTAGLLRQRLGQPDGITPRTRRLLHMALIRDIIRRHLGNPMLDPNGIAEAANISPRYLHQLFQGAELTPMQLLKRLRLQECHRSLRDPALAMTPVKDVIAAHGYLRPDQFARDFKQHFGVSATQIRRLASQRSTGREG
ncbi:MAG TPA: helix-turn-helix domain-containing protein [Pseudonocardiaceae bacterium]|nr:helix-turn-helix domain-containing protein [Pseudonocardiaceae bacterium]